MSVDAEPGTARGTRTATSCKVHDVARHARLARELRTVRAMLRIHCRDLHGEAVGLCADCTALMDYATRRLDRCVFGDDKPTCANCRVHCYNADMRERMRAVMRYSGPRMVLRHPLLALAHIVDGHRPAPPFPAPARSRSDTKN